MSKHLSLSDRLARSEAREHKNWLVEHGMVSTIKTDDTPVVRMKSIANGKNVMVTVYQDDGKAPDEYQCFVSIDGNIKPMLAKDVDSYIERSSK